MKVDSDPAVRLVLCTCRCATTGARGLTVHATLVVYCGGTACFAGYDEPRACVGFSRCVLLDCRHAPGFRHQDAMRDLFHEQKSLVT